MILITTPTGDIGSQLVRMLLDSTDTALRVIARDPARIPAGLRDRIDVVTGSHYDPAVLDRALDGADALFWNAAPNPAAATLDEVYAGAAATAAELLAAHGTGHVVTVSALGRGTSHQADAGLVTASLAMDDALSAAVPNFRALANASFMDNLLRQTAQLRDTGVFSGPMPAQSRQPTVATRDIAAAAARLLLDRAWTGSAEEPLLGPEDLSPDEQSATVSAVLGRQVTYRQEPLDSVETRLLGFGASPAFAGGMAAMVRAKAEHGLDTGIPRTPAAATAAPTTFHQWCERVLKPALARS
ncbi:NAD(P)H-binding protein [Kitasatospora sp. NPDC048538]|uniref:NAD(P)H-binding protein n=1 Tax=unclassified Kitasatospora TaxID=2633591 RepID=UPI0033D10545